MSHVLIRRSGTLIDISPDGVAPLDPGIVAILQPSLSYQHKTLLRGHARYGPDGNQHSVDIETRNMYAIEEGRLVTGFGFLQRLADILRRHGITPHYIDISPPKNPSVYTPDWENASRYTQFRARQEDCLRSITENECGMIVAAAGFGKAQPVYEKVLTPSGWRLLSDIRVGDRVIGQDGKPTVVQGVYPQGDKDIIAVDFSDRTTVHCCPEHLWAVQTSSDRNRDQGFKVLSAQELRTSLYRPDGRSKWFVPTVEPVQFRGGKVPIDPYLLGCLLGDGGLTIACTISSADEEILGEIEDLVTRLGLHLRYRSGVDYGISGRKGRKNPLTEALRGLGLHGLKSAAKFVPDAYKYGSLATRIRLLQGLMDTDGTVSDDCRRYAEFGPVASRKLAEDVCDLIRGLGGVTRVQTSYRKAGTYYRVRTNIDTNLFRLSRKAVLWKADKSQGRTKAIRAMRDVGRAPCVCLSVANQDGLYVTSGYTVTHNTYIIEALCHLYPRAKFDIIVKPTDVAARIVRQLTRTIPNVGQVGKGKLRKGDRVTVYSAMSAHRAQNSDADFLIGDEIHQLMTSEIARSMAQSWRFTRNFGLTATPDGRLDGAHAQLELFFGPKIFELSYQEAMELGLVVPIHVRWIPIRLTHNPAENRSGITAQRWGIWRNQDRNREIAEDVRRNYPDPNTQILILTATVEHAIMLWQFLPEFALCHGESITDDDIERYKRNNLLPQNFVPVDSARREYLRDNFSAGTIKRVIATDVWSTGVDFAQLQVLYRADARESSILDTQGPCRVSRVSPETGKSYGEVVDCCDFWDRSFKRKSESRKRNYQAHGWTQDWPTGRI